MGSRRHLRCPHCGFLDTIKRGKRAGYSRYSCKNCGSYFTDRRSSVSRKNKEVWFREWIVGKRTFSQLVCDSPYSERTLKRYFYEMLPLCPVWHIQRRERVNLLIDATYFPNKVCLVLYRDANIRMTLFYRLTDGEHFRELQEDLRNILKTGIRIGEYPQSGAGSMSRSDLATMYGTYHPGNRVVDYTQSQERSGPGATLAGTTAQSHPHAGAGTIMDQNFYRLVQEIPDFHRRKNKRRTDGKVVVYSQNAASERIAYQTGNTRDVYLYTISQSAQIVKLH